ncbi:MAG: hypothetical protein EZS26_003233 [Candidatus Ordinivivax streblomastigis]|uniref:Uncharacterized protein n=1 Tax=Candidatus Ordinivivax streblomastigis TaxID=2540710 RepID=A0A5M8NW69_9BACT|nr:MAG: hypothetical protein EZS26_003233 [Candidatus Ordinivivax streblomastigis]
MLNFRSSLKQVLRIYPICGISRNQSITYFCRIKLAIIRYDRIYVDKKIKDINKVKVSHSFDYKLTL